MFLLNNLFSFEIVIFNLVILTLFFLLARYIFKKNRKVENDFLKKQKQQERNEIVDILIHSLRHPAILLSKKGKLLAFNDSFSYLIANYDENGYVEDASYIYKFIIGGLVHKREELIIKNKTYYVDLTKIDIDNFKRVLITFTDISIIKDTYTRQEMFINDVKHELKTPVTAIMGLSELLVKNKVSDEDDKKKVLNTINSESNRLGNLINSLTSTIEPKAEKIEFNISELFNELSLIYDNKTRDIELKFVNYVEYPIISDPKILKQILINLIDNSVKFTNDGYICVSAYENNNHIIISVVDTGIGIGEKELSYIFDRFYRVNKEKNVTEFGYGLGLSIVKGLTKKIDAKINVESEKNKGTTFTISFNNKKRG